MQNKSLTSSNSLNDYHHQRSKEASKAVQEMLKQPLSQKEVVEQAQRLNMQKKQESAIDDIADNLLNALEDGYKKGYSTMPIDEDTLMNFLSDESKITPEHEELLDTLKNLIDELESRPQHKKQFLKEKFLKMTPEQKTKVIVQLKSIQAAKSRQEYHERMKPMKEAHEKATERMMKQPCTFEQAVEQLTKLREERERNEKVKQTVIDKFIDRTYSRIMDFTNGKYHKLHPRLRTLLIGYFLRH